MLRLAPILALALLAAPAVAGAAVAEQKASAPKAATTLPAPTATPAKPATTAAKPAAKADTFSRWIEDLPVMPGLTETDGGYSFEVAQGGRLAEARLHGTADAEVVRSFYASTLPPLGWQPEPTQPFLYRRGRERLILHVQPAKPQGVMAVFVLSPRAATPLPLPPS